MFATAWSGFHKFSRGPSLMTYFNDSPASGWTRTFRLDYIELPWVSLNNSNSNIYASYNAFINHYNLFLFLKKKYFVLNNPEQAYSCLWKIFCSSQTRTKHTPAYVTEPNIIMLMNQNQAYSCLWTRTKHTHAYVTEPSITHAYVKEQSIFMLIWQNQAYSCLWARTDKSLLLTTSLSTHIGLSFTSHLFYADDTQLFIAFITKNFPLPSRT